jgi:hypothetical protein
MNKGKIGEICHVLSRNNIEKENGVSTKHNREINWYKYRERNGTVKKCENRFRNCNVRTPKRKVIG